MQFNPQALTQRPRCQLLSCKAYEAELPWGKRYVAVCRDVRVPDELLESASRGLPPSRLLVRLAEEPDPCALAVALSYVEEDYSSGLARLRTPSLQALLYLTSSRQVDEAISRSKGGDILAFGAESPQALTDLMRSFGLSPGPLHPLPQCDRRSLGTLAASRLDIMS